MINELEQQIDRLTNFHNLMKSLPKNTDQTAKIIYVGKLMKYFYMLYDSEEFENMIHYSFGFHGYIDCVLGISKNIQEKKLQKCYYNKNLTFKIKNMYHPAIENPVKNNINIKKNIIITGPALLASPCAHLLARAKSNCSCVMIGVCNLPLSACRER